MESMITVLYLEKPRKFKQFKAKETMGSYHPSGPVSSPGLMLGLHGWQIPVSKHLVCFQQSY